MGLEHILNKVRLEESWKTFAIQSDKGEVLGGCVLREHENPEETFPMAELFLLAIKSECQAFGLGRHLIEDLQLKYSKIVTFADLRATKFFSKMGFK